LGSLLLAAALLCFVGVAVAPMLAWFSFRPLIAEKHEDRKEIDGYGNVEKFIVRDDGSTGSYPGGRLGGHDEDLRPDGIPISAVSGTLGLLTGLGLGVFLSGVPGRKQRAILTSVLVAALVGSVVLTVWHAAWLCKVASLWAATRDDLYQSEWFHIKT